MALTITFDSQNSIALSDDVEASIHNWMIGQTVQTGTDGNNMPIIAPKYDSIPALFVAHCTALVSTLVDQYPTPDIQAAKDTAAAALADVESAKAAVLSGQLFTPSVAQIAQQIKSPPVKDPAQVGKS